MMTEMGKIKYLNLMVRRGQGGGHGRRLNSSERQKLWRLRGMSYKTIITI